MSKDKKSGALGRLVWLLALATACGRGPAQSAPGPAPVTDARIAAAPIDATVGATARLDAAPPADAAVALTSPPDAGATAPDRRAVQLACHLRRCCARMDDGAVRCWGSRWNGDHYPPIFASPVELPGLAHAVHLSLYDTAVWIADAEGRIWGRGFDLTYKQTLTPVKEVADARAVLPLGRNGYVVRRDGTVLVYGEEPWLPAGTVPAAAYLGYVPIPGLEKVVELTRANLKTCARHEDGHVTCWDRARFATVEGLDAVGFVAEGCARRRDGRVHCLHHDPSRFEDRNNVARFASGSGFSCELSDAGEVSCRGDNAYGQLGDGTRVAREAVAPVDLPKAIDLATGSDSACALLADGDVRCWGRNQGGQIGDGTLIDRLAPVPVAGITAVSLPPVSDGLLAVQESAVTMSWAGLPRGCQKQAPLLDRDDPFVTPVSAYALPAPDVEGGGLQVALADFRLEPRALDGMPTRGRQSLVVLHLWRAGKKVVDRGRYMPDDGSARKLGLVHYYGDNMSFGIVEDGDAVVVEVLTKDWICGRLELLMDDGKAVKSSFAARRVPANQR